MLLGAHVSIAGGYLNALVEARRLGIDAIQIFTKNQRFWKERQVQEEEGEEFRSAMVTHGVKQAFSHAIYLISLGSENEEIAEKSVQSLAMELHRCAALGLTHTVMHPGSSGRFTTDEGIVRIGDNIRKALALTRGIKVKVLLENTAGGGSSVGGRLEHLGDLIDYINSPRIGLCIDTCHAFAAGYDIRTEKATATFLDLVGQRIGHHRLLCFHLNDSKGALGSRIDRHAAIGQGHLGTAPFKHIMQQFPHVPKVIETPKENEMDVQNLALLRTLAKTHSAGVKKR